jgi:hypothetical protein
MKSKIQVKLMWLCLFFFNIRFTQFVFLLQGSWLTSLHLCMFMGAQFFIKGWYYFWMHLYIIKKFTYRENKFKTHVYCVETKWIQSQQSLLAHFYSYINRWATNSHIPLCCHVNPSFLIHRETTLPFSLQYFCKN